VLDLGCAPGGWAEYAVSVMSKRKQKKTPVLDVDEDLQSKAAEEPHVIGVDILPMVPLAGSFFVQGDMRDLAVQKKVLAAAGHRPVNLVLSDMAPNLMGDRSTDHYRSVELAEIAFATAASVLSDGGAVLCKVLRGQDDQELVKFAKDQGFRKVRWAKPVASRSESNESFLFATEFKFQIHIGDK